MNKEGFTLVELLIVLAVLSILAIIAIPAYVGQQKRAARTEAYSNLQNLRLLEEQYFADSAAYTDSAGNCAKDKDNVAAIQAKLSGFKPGSGLKFSYCIEKDKDINGAATGCFRARAFGNSGTSVQGDIFVIDCNNKRNF